MAHADGQRKVSISLGDPRGTRLTELDVESPVESLSVSRDGRWLACGQQGGTVTVWQVEIGRVDAWRVASQATLAASEDNLTLVAFSPIDDSLAVANGTALLLLRLDVQALAADDVPTPADLSEPEAVNETLNASDTSDATVTRAVTTLSIGTNASGTRATFVVASSRGQLTLRQDWPDRAALLMDLAELDKLGVPSGDASSRRLVSLTQTLREKLVPYGLVDSPAISGDDAPLALAVEGALADMPWELLLADRQGVPLAITRGLVRKPPDDSIARPSRDGEALVVDLWRGTGGMPSSNLEADVVVDRIAASHAFAAGVGRLHDPTSKQVLEALQREPVRLLVVTGQGLLQTAPQTPSTGDAAIDLGDGIRLDGSMLAGLHQVPEIVYFDAGHFSRYAPGLARQGVDVVVAPLWEVSPRGGQLFSTAFLDALLAGDTLALATRKAREAARAGEPGSTAWAAFQVHGDARYRFERHVAVGSTAAATTSPAPPPTVIDLTHVVAPNTADSQRVVHARSGVDLMQLSIRHGPELTLAIPTVQTLLAEWAPGDGAREGPSASLGFAEGVVVEAVQVLTPADFSTTASVHDAAVELDTANGYGLHLLSLGRMDVLANLGRRLGEMPRVDTPIVLLVHGLLVDTATTFGKLWSDSGRTLRRLFAAHADQVYAFEYPTLTIGPIEVAWQIAQSLPDNGRIRLLTHGSGGLVGEILACLAPESQFSGSNVLRSFDGAPDDHERLRLIAARLADRRVRIERIVRVACPANGNSFAQGRHDLYLSILDWALQLARLPVSPRFDQLAMAVARDVPGFADLPGIAAQLPDSALIRWIRGCASLIGDLRMINANVRGDVAMMWVRSLIADADVERASDLGVATRSMYGGAPRQSPALFMQRNDARTTHFNYFDDPEVA
ncbi:MAG: CHAT domain-containing protein, partial [Betaproteobacteria bacterium]